MMVPLLIPVEVVVMAAAKSGGTGQNGPVPERQRYAPPPIFVVSLIDTTLLPPFQLAEV
jgi:hypothetical protein